MRVKDIVKINGVWVYHIREDGEYGNEETKVKAPYSERILILSPVLIDTLGFIKYVQKMDKILHYRVFHELTKIGTVRFQQNVGKFFNNRYLKKIGLKDGVRKVSFHSFRHSVETHLTKQMVWV